MTLGMTNVFKGQSLREANTVGEALYIAMDSNGRIFGSSFDFDSVYEYLPSGEVLVVAGPHANAMSMRYIIAREDAACNAALYEEGRKFDLYKLAKNALLLLRLYIICVFLLLRLSIIFYASFPLSASFSLCVSSSLDY